MAEALRRPLITGTKWGHRRLLGNQVFRRTAIRNSVFTPIRKRKRSEPSIGIRSLLRKCTCAYLYLAFLSIAGPLARCQQIPRAQRHYQRAIELERKKAFRAAADEFSKAIEINPEFRAAYYQLGVSDREAGDAQGAIRAFMQLVQLEPGNIEAMNSAADVYLNIGYYNDALALCLRSLRLRPQSATIWFRAGSVYLRQKQYPQAVDAFRKALTFSAQMVDASRALSATYVTMGDLKDARQELEAATKVNPQSPELILDLGEVDLAEGRFSDARREFRAALSIRPGYVPALLGIGRVDRLSGRLRLEGATKTRPKPSQDARPTP
jgi:tetratricopeptide (TPR) repeat protein